MSENATTADVLRRAKDVLWEKGWTKGRFENSAGEVCTLGACMVAAGTSICDARPYDPAEVVYRNTSAVLNELVQAEGYRCADHWNDQPERTFDDVLDLFDAAIKRCEQPESGRG